LWLVGTNGTAQQFRWSLASVPAGACYQFTLADLSGALAIDSNCDGTVDGVLPAVQTPVQELPPQLITALQDINAPVGRPMPHCDPQMPNNYGAVLAVLFSKPMTQSSVNVPAAYQFDNGNAGYAVQIQPGGRVALINMQMPFSALRPRTLTISGVTDPRGRPLNVVAQPINSPLYAGIVVRGRVVRADGSVAAGIPVTLTMYDQYYVVSSGECLPYTVRLAQVFTDAEGSFSFDFVLAGMLGYSVSATDTSGLSATAIRAIIDSTYEGNVDSQRLLNLANSADIRNSLLAEFAVGSLPEAIVAAEGLDRALLRDFVDTGSARVGTEVVVGLRFRGRATVTGQVLAADGVTPVYNTAVNLFPHPSSREQGRGMFSDAQGNFAFYGVPLGTFSINAVSPSSQARTVAGYLDQVNETNNVVIVLSTNQVYFGNVSGRVVESDNTTPIPGAQVFVGKPLDGGGIAVAGSATADASGFWSVTNLVCDTYIVAAISVDGKRSGKRDNVIIPPGGTVQVTVSLPGTATVHGKVVMMSGTPVPNAVVAGGESLVTTDAKGLFTLTGVPTGVRGIDVGLARNPAAGINFPRFGHASLTVFEGVDNSVLVQITPAGAIVGQVRDADGRPVPNVQVAIPLDGGFQWVKADGQGNYAFENMALDGYTLSAPSPAAGNSDVSGLEQQIASGDTAEIAAALNEAYKIFTGAADPNLNGQAESFNPGSWGYTHASLLADGETVVANITYLPNGTVSGVTLNGQGTPIGARVRLTGLGPNPVGAPTILTIGERNSDPATGLFQFTGQLKAGPWGLQAASPFYPTIITAAGMTTILDTDVTNVVLQFPRVQEVNGRLIGNVVEPDGTPAGSNVQVKISFSSDYMIRTDTNGWFDTQIAIPAGGYSVQALDPSTGLQGVVQAQVKAGITNYTDKNLLFCHPAGY